MQGAAKRSEGSNIFKLSDITNHPADSASSSIGEAESGPAVIGRKEGAGGNPREAEPSANERSASASPANADDALAWLKIIQSATADLTADIRPSKGDGLARSFADEPELYERNPPSAAGSAQRSAGFYEDGQDDYSDERKLAQKLSYRYAERPSAPPQTLGAAVMPYVAATGIFAFIAGSAAVYFLTGSSSVDVKAREAAPAVEMQVEAPMTQSGQPGSKKGNLQRAPSQASSADSAGFWGSKTEEQAPKAANSAAPADHRLQTWSDTVETFKQFVRPEQK